MLSAAAKTATWLLRLLQFFFAVILMGITAYMIHQYRDGGFIVPREVILPLVASVLATAITAFSIVAICFLGSTLQLVAAFLDFVVFVLYLASAGLLHANFHVRRQRNWLYLSLVAVRGAQGKREDRTLQSGLVKMLAAGTIIQIFLFFTTMILGTLVAMRNEEKRLTQRRHVV